VARAPGTYSFHCCNRCGVGHGGMKGQLIVEP
jgi:heme/copper-type cytochrome/quinol oxidase subunit 2